MTNKIAKSQKSKYRINEELAKFGTDARAEKRKEILAATGLNKSTLSEWANIKQDEARMIPFDSGLQIARILGCKPQELLAS